MLVAGCSQSHLHAAPSQSNTYGGTPHRPRLQAAAAQLGEAKKAAGGARVDPALPQRIAESAAGVVSDLATARRDNDTVYLQRVPPADQIARCAAWS